MNTAVAKQLDDYSIEDIYNLPDCQRAELIDGELYMMATPGRVHQELVTDFTYFIKDYIKNPKENGYRSLHLIIEIPIFLHNETRNMKVEVQLRTITMESWADLEHKLRYKKDLSEELDSKISKELNECADLCNILDKKMLSVKNIVFKSSTDKKPS